MGTRSAVSIFFKSTRVHMYSHWDGGFESMGVFLLQWVLWLLSTVKVGKKKKGRYSGSKRNMNQFNTTSALLNDLKERERDFEVMPLETIGHFMGIEYVYEIDLDRKTFVAKQVGLHEQLWTGHWPLETELNDLDGDVGWDVGWDYTKDTVLRFDLTKSPKDIMNRWKASIKKYNRKLMGDDEKMFDEIARGKKSTFVSDGGQREEIQNKIEEQVKQRLKKMKEDFDQRGLQEFKETEGSKHTRKRKQESD